MAKNPFARLAAKMTLKQRLWAILFSFLLLLALFLAFTIKDRLGLSFVERFFSYDNQKNSLAFSHGARSENLFANLNYQLLVCSDSLLQLYAPTGEAHFKTAINFTQPALSSNGKRAVIFDAGGQSLYVVEKTKVIHSITLPAEQYILSATINQNGWLAVTSKTSGVKGLVTVYNSSFDLVADISRSSSYLASALVTPDNRGLYVLSPGQSAGIFQSTLLYYDLRQQSQEPRGISLGNNVVLSMQTGSNRCWVLGESELFILSSGELSAKYGFEGKYLKRATLDGNDFATLLLSDSPSGNAGTLVTVDGEGKELGRLELDEQVLAISASGRRVAVLTASHLFLYNKDLSETYRTDQLQGAQNLVLYPDGSLSLLTDELARLHIP